VIITLRHEERNSLLAAVRELGLEWAMVESLLHSHEGLPEAMSRTDSRRALMREGVFAKPFRLPRDPVFLPGCDEKTLSLLGEAMFAFYRELDFLYFQSLEPGSPFSFVHEVLDAGKPDSLLQFARSRKFRKDLPLVLRPDLLLTPAGPKLTEMDSVPGGMGILLKISRILQDHGKTGIWGNAHGILEGFAAMIRSLDPNPRLAIVVSEESKDYWPEMVYLARCLADAHFPAICLRPHELRFDENGLFYRDQNLAEHRISVVYRFFELFDLPNIPKSDILLYFAKGGKVKVTPPFKPWLEEKAGLALFKTPRLRSFWRSRLVPDHFEVLDKMIPSTWVLDPRPVPSPAIVPDLVIGDRSLWDFSELRMLTQKERHIIIKPSGFSPLAWGSRGVVVGHDLPEDEWQKSLDHAFSSFAASPHVLQPFLKTSAVPCPSWDSSTGLPTEEKMRVRACPYYFVVGQTVWMGGVLATAVPMDKKIIHGMVDSILLPAAHPDYRSPDALTNDEETFAPDRHHTEQDM